MNIKHSLIFFRYNCKINSAKLSTNEKLHPYRTASIKFVKIHITSEHFFHMEYCVIKSM